jgi:hypothetical protein
MARHYFNNLADITEILFGKCPRRVRKKGVMMSDPKGWPDPAHPGIPPNPDRQGPHLIVDEYGTRRWAWCTPDGLGPNGFWGHATATGNRGLNWCYIGPAMAPDGQPVD